MTEEMTIDGVDVSGCVYYNPQNDTGKWCDLTCERDDAPAFRCEQIKNCVYKQLKRLEADYKKLKEELEQIKGICKEAISLCNCFDADVDYNCINCRDGGRAKLAKEIMEVLKDE